MYHRIYEILRWRAINSDFSGNVLAVDTSSRTLIWFHFACDFGLLISFSAILFVAYGPGIFYMLQINSSIDTGYHASDIVYQTIIMLLCVVILFTTFTDNHAPDDLANVRYVLDDH